MGKTRKRRTHKKQKGGTIEDFSEIIVEKVSEIRDDVSIIKRAMKTHLTPNELYEFVRDSGIREEDIKALESMISTLYQKLYSFQKMH